MEGDEGDECSFKGNKDGSGSIDRAGYLPSIWLNPQLLQSICREVIDKTLNPTVS